MTRAGHRLGLSSAGVAAAFSLLGHAAVALVAARHEHAERPPHFDAALVVPESDFVLAEDERVAEPEAPAVAPSTVHAVAPRTAPAHSEAIGTPNPAREAAPAAEHAAPSVLDASTGPRFAMTLAPTVGHGASVVATAASSAPSGAGVGVAMSGPIAAASADIPPRLRSGSLPSYTAAALAAGVEANVLLEIVVSETGAVSSARVLEHVGYGLDEAARRGVLTYHFSPAVRGGKATAVRMHWPMRFELR